MEQFIKIAPFLSLMVINFLQRSLMIPSFKDTINNRQNYKHDN